MELIHSNAGELMTAHKAVEQACQPWSQKFKPSRTNLLAQCQSEIATSPGETDFECFQTFVSQFCFNFPCLIVACGLGYDLYANDMFSRRKSHGIQKASLNGLN